MPIYQYACRACGRSFEELVSSREAPPACPSCAAHDAERVLSVVTVGRSPAAAQALARSFASTGGAGASPCGSCGDARGPGACALDS